MHFARRYEGPKTSLPCFRGIRGPGVVRSLLEIEATFEKNLQILKDVRRTILDVKVHKDDVCFFLVSMFVIVYCKFIFFRLQLGMMIITGIFF